MTDSVPIEGPLPEKKKPDPLTVVNNGTPVEPTPLELEVYKILATLFNSEETSFWTRNNILVAIHGALIAATAAILGGAEKVLTPGAPTIAAILLFGALAVLSFVGFSMAVTWLFLVGRSERIADTVSAQLKVIEKEFATRSSILMREPFQAFSIFGAQLDPEETKQTLSPRQWNNNIRLSVLWRRVGWGLTFLWAILLALFIFLSFQLRPPPAPSQTNNELMESVKRIERAAEQSAIDASRAAKAVDEAVVTMQKLAAHGKEKQGARRQKKKAHSH